MKKKYSDCLIWEHNGYKVVNQYLESLTLQKKFKSNFIMSLKMEISE